MAVPTDSATLPRDQLREYLSTHATVPLMEATAILGLTTTEGYRGAQRGTIPTIRYGRRKLVTTAWLSRQIGLDDES